MTYWGTPGYQDEPVDPNPVAPAVPPGWVPPASGAPSYSPYGYPAPPLWNPYRPPRDPRPGAATGAAVLGFVLGGLLLLEGFLLLVGASVVESIEQSLDQSTGLPPSLIVNGVLDLAVGGALIAGGVLLMSRNPPGRVLLAVADVVVVGQSIYWTVVSDVGALAVTLLHAALAVVSFALALAMSTSAWLRPDVSEAAPH